MTKPFNKALPAGVQREKEAVQYLKDLGLIEQAVHASNAQNKTGWDVELLVKGSKYKVDIKTYDQTRQQIANAGGVGYFDRYGEQVVSLELAHGRRSCCFAKQTADLILFNTAIFNERCDKNALQNKAWYEKKYGKKPVTIFTVERPFLTWLCAKEAYKAQMFDWAMHTRENKKTEGESQGLVLYATPTILKDLEAHWAAAGRPSTQYTKSSLKDVINGRQTSPVASLLRA